jgi:hypothetical protein
MNGASPTSACRPSCCSAWLSSPPVGPGLGRGWRSLILAGATLDFIAGIVLHFAVQNHALDRLLVPARDYWSTVASHNPQAMQNALGLHVNAVAPIPGAYPPVSGLVLALLAAILILALWRSQAATKS